MNQFNPGEAAKVMRDLPLEDRLAAINAADNVVGYDRFVARNNQVALSRWYKKPWAEPPRLLT